MKSLFALLTTICLLVSGCSEPGEDRQTELVMFCAAGIKAPVTKVAENYRKEFGIDVRLQFGGSGTLLSNLQIAPGDIYLAADASYIEEAKKKNLIDKSFPIATMKAGFGVPKGNPGGLKSLRDLNREGIRVAIGNPDSASIGRFTRKVLSKHKSWDSLEPTVSFPTVNELANAVKLGTVDVVIIWDAVAFQYPDVDFVSIPEFDAEEKEVTVAVVSSSKNKTDAELFCQYLANQDKGLKIFEQEGFNISKTKGSE